MYSILSHMEQLTIDRLNDDGIGIATWQRPDGFEKKVEVPYTLPQETVEGEMRKSGRRLLSMVPATITAPSPDRVEPKCPHFGSCGGCSLQHMNYQAQLAWKQNKIEKLFDGHTVHPIIASPREYGYRNKLEMSFSETRKGDSYLGLILSRTKGYVFNLKECHLAAPWFQEVVQAVRAWWLSSDLKAYAHGKDTGSLRTLALRHGVTFDDRMVILTVSGNPEFALKKEQLDGLVKAVHQVCNATVVLRIQQILKGQPTQFYEMVLAGKDYLRETIQGLEFHISPSAFFQPNSFTAELLYKRAIELAGITKDSVVYDLYCGGGSFGMCAALTAKQVYGVELNRDAAYDAKCNAERLGLTNYTILTGDVGAILKEKSAELPTPDVVIVDPPRAGLEPKACQEVLRLRAKTLLYVSCKPETQRKNMDEIAAAGYTIQHIQPVDQFPHTPHVENIVVCTL